LVQAENPNCKANQIVKFLEKKSKQYKNFSIKNYRLFR